jgi:hypothetical protein
MKATERRTFMSSAPALRRVILTFEFNPSTVTRDQLVERLDAALETAFPDKDVDVDTRWVSVLADAPLFGAGRRIRTRRAGA